MIVKVAANALRAKPLIDVFIKDQTDNFSLIFIDF